MRIRLDGHDAEESFVCRGETVVETDTVCSNRLCMKGVILKAPLLHAKTGDESWRRLKDL
jgi:hypothetical protein